MPGKNTDPSNSHGSDTTSAARNRADAVRLGAESIHLNLLGFWQAGDWAELGYASFEEFVSAEFGHLSLKLPVPERRALVEQMSEQGVPVRDQAAITGTSEPTIKRDRQGSNEPSASEVTPAARAPKGSNEPSPQEPPPGMSDADVAGAGLVADAATAHRPRPFHEPNVLDAIEALQEAVEKGRYAAGILTRGGKHLGDAGEALTGLAQGLHVVADCIGSLIDSGGITDNTIARFIGGDAL